MIVLDTNVLSEPLRRDPDPRVVRWLDDQHPRTLYVTAMTLAELRAGVEVLPSGRRRDLLRERLEEEVIPFFEDRVLPFDGRASRAWARLQAHARTHGRPLPVMDSLIAAVVIARGYALATRNTADFVATGVELINPWEVGV
ncbi:MAG: type II toxin-antitoxin system VapC family toxin [Actinomyces urogenitalis]|uniref:type II toxin-antitoxin system VapC family toxin n=1 Tax=Actinomyces urogenitalis TaxID=103621 RepID=UPI00065FA531|nr:type II toxin-antitoxin system VapC family toxin [Actinomyces urogenitalis]MBS6072871.1 type II toxin-antitoxin system VapC family toxin [Actinomyces urogenitalis]MDU7428197.1 type II toxin-antitoxin system VapC family toxin [Actinomyces urogenitalis]